jgi:hypothetical protein
MNKGVIRLYGDMDGIDITVDIVTERIGNNGTMCQTIINKDTGEVISSKFIKESDKPTGRPPADGRKPHFYKVYCTNWQDVVTKKHLTPYEAGVFFMMLSFIKWESNFIVDPKSGANLNCSQLAKLLDVDRSNLSDTLDILNRKGLIAIVKCGDKSGNHYLLNSNVVFAGSQIKDVSEHSRFTKDCPFEPPITLKYQERGKG